MEARYKVRGVMPKFEMTGREAVQVAPWVWALAVSVGIQLMTIAYMSGTVVTRIDALSDRIGRLRQMDAVTNITRGPIRK